MSKKLSVIGFTGPISSGKGVLIDRLATAFNNKPISFSLSQMVRDEATSQGLDYENTPEGRKILQDVGNDLREKFGDTVLGKRAVDKIKDLNKFDQNYFLIDGIRNPREVDALREGLENRFNLIGIDAPAPIRWQRAIERNRGSDAKTIEEIAEIDERDMKIGIPHCLAKADYIIYNFNKDINELHNELMDYVYSSGIIEKPFKRPSWDDYFLAIADAVGRRGTCARRRFGAILVNNDSREILATGYVGAPKGTPHCPDPGVGCYRKVKGIPSGQNYEYCRSVHAEQNVIQKVALRDTKNTTLYLVGRNLEKPGWPIIEAPPCNYCQREIMNTDIEKVIIYNKNGSVHTPFYVQEWREENKRNPYSYLDENAYSSSVIGNRPEDITTKETK